MYSTANAGNEVHRLLRRGSRPEVPAWPTSVASATPPRPRVPTYLPGTRPATTSAATSRSCTTMSALTTLSYIGLLATSPLPPCCRSSCEAQVRCRATTAATATLLEVKFTPSLQYSPIETFSAVADALELYEGCSFYLRAKSLTPEHYQCLVDRSWRRCAE